MASFAAHLMPGSPYPLGATWDGLGTNFAVFSAHAERMDLCLFDPSGRREIARMPLPECTDEIWHGADRGRLAGAGSDYKRTWLSMTPGSSSCKSAASGPLLAPGVIQAA